MPGASDKGCETLGMGVLGPDCASISFGTTATIQTTTKNYLEPIRFMPAYVAAMPGFYNPEVEVFRGYWMVSWFKKEFCAKEVMEAETRNTPVEQLLEGPSRRHSARMQRLAASALLGRGFAHAGGKRLYHRVWRRSYEGAPLPRDCRGHQLRAHGRQRKKSSAAPSEKSAVSWYRAVARRATRFAGLPPICSASLSIKVLHMKPRAWGPPSSDSWARVPYPSYEEAIREMVHYERVFEPHAEYKQVYSDLYRNIYKGIYPSLRHLYRRLESISKLCVQQP